MFVEMPEKNLEKKSTIKTLVGDKIIRTINYILENFIMKSFILTNAGVWI